MVFHANVTTIFFVIRITRLKITTWTVLLWITIITIQFEWRNLKLCRGSVRLRRHFILGKQFTQVQNISFFTKVIIGWGNHKILYYKKTKCRKRTKHLKHMEYLKIWNPSKSDPPQKQEVPQEWSVLSEVPQNP